MTAKTKQIEKPYGACFETLANELRVEILRELEKKESSVLDLAEKLKVEQSRLSHALKTLRDCNYVDFEVKGKERLYFLNQGVKKGLEESSGKSNLAVFAFIDSHIEQHCQHECKKLHCSIAHE